MLERLLKSKVYIIAIAVIVLAILGFFIGSAIKQKMEGNSKQNLKQEEPYDGDGLEVDDEMDEGVESIDGSGSWEEKTEDNQKDKDKDSESNTKKEDKVDSSKDDSAEDSSSDELQEDILEDNKVWGEIS
jgi:ABC-type Na+ efflux pump permease subunit